MYFLSHTVGEQFAMQQFECGAHAAQRWSLQAWRACLLHLFSFLS